jgi:O-methyltransferase
MVSRAIYTHSLLPHTMGGRLALDNAFDVVWKVNEEGVEGALVECGVAEGGTSAMMAVANRLHGSSSRTKWLFDSFEGLPEPTEEDYQGGRTGNFI